MNIIKGDIKMMYCKHCNKKVKEILDLIEVEYICSECDNYILRGE
jgi:hypothetical protein